MKNVTITIYNKQVVDGNVVNYGSGGKLLIDNFTWTGSGSFNGLITTSRAGCNVTFTIGKPLAQIGDNVYILDVSPREDDLNHTVYNVHGEYSNLYSQLLQTGVNVNMIAKGPFVTNGSDISNYSKNYSGAVMRNRTTRTIDLFKNSMVGDLQTYIQANGTWYNMGAIDIASLTIPKKIVKWQGVTWTSEVGGSISDPFNLSILDFSSGPLKVSGSFEMDTGVDYTKYIAGDSDILNGGGVNTSNPSESKISLQNAITTWSSIDKTIKYNPPRDAAFYGGGHIEFSMELPTGGLSWTRSWDFIKRINEQGDYTIQFVTSGDPSNRTIHVIDNGEEVASGSVGYIQNAINEGPYSKKMSIDVFGDTLKTTLMASKIGKGKYDTNLDPVSNIVRELGNDINGLLSGILGYFGNLFFSSKTLAEAAKSMLQPVSTVSNSQSSIKKSYAKMSKYIGGTVEDDSPYVNRPLIIKEFGGCSDNQTPDDPNNPVVGTYTRAISRRLTLDNGLADIYNQYNSIEFYNTNQIYVSEINNLKPNY